MKNVFALEKRTETFDGEKFIARRVDKEYADKQKRQDEEENKFERTAGMPVWINVCGLVVLFLGTVFLCGFLEALEDNSFALIYERAGWCLIVGCVFVAVGGIVLIVSAVRNKRAKESSAYAYLQEKRERLNRESLEAMRVSETAKRIDVIAMLYTKKKNGKTPYKEGGLTTVRFNLSAFVYAENEALHFAFPDCVFAIPFRWILRIQCIGKSISAAGWNKGEGKKNRLTGTFEWNGCKVTVNNGGDYVTKPYYRMTLRDENYEEYYILIPCYDIETVFALTGRSAE